MKGVRLCAVLLAAGYAVAGILPAEVLAFEDFKVCAKGEPDEFFNGIGQPYVPFGEQSPDAEGKPKVNYTYVWGLKATATDVWCGVAANIVPLTIGATASSGGGAPEPEESSWSVSEYGESKYPLVPQRGGDLLGDWRIPKMYRYVIDTEELVDITPYDDPLLEDCLGIRAVGCSNNVVFMGGQSLRGFGIVMFAFNETTGEFLGSKFLFNYSDVRHFLEIGDDLYIGVLNTSLRGGGTILKWRGNERNPFGWFAFEQVGKVNNEVAYLCEHEGRIACTTWPTVPNIFSPYGSPNLGASLWLSPPVPSGGLKRSHRNKWTEIWNASDYEPDPVIATSYAGGPVCSYKGDLYWSTMHLVGGSQIALIRAYGPNVSNSGNAFRETQMFRGKNVSDSEQRELQVLYGNNDEAVYDPQSDTWTDTEPLMGPRLYGPAGYTPGVIPYTWSMAVHDDKLYFGTFDAAFFLLGDDYVENGIEDPYPGSYSMGGNLHCFESADSPAVDVDLFGGGNVTNHGYRNLSSNGTHLYCGMANLANLLTDPDDDLADGGWELLRYEPAAP